MPSRRLLGEPIPSTSTGLTLVPANPTPIGTSPVIYPDRWCRNGLHPNAHYANLVREATNSLVLYRTKEICGFVGRTYTAQLLGSFGMGERDRYRAAFHTSPYHHGLLAIVVMHPPNVAGAGNNTYGRLRIYDDTQESSVVVTRDFFYGDSPTGTTGYPDPGSAAGFQHLKPIIMHINGLTADTDYYLKFSDYDYGLIQSAAILDLQSMTENTDGYLGLNVTAQTPILDVHRESINTMQHAMWRRGASRAFNWTVEDGTSPLTRSSSTHINVADNTTTAVSASSLGYTLVMDGKARKSTGVEVVMSAFGKMNTGTGGSVRLLDSGGATVAQITGWGTTAEWRSIAFSIPDTTAKYDLHFANGGSNAFSLYACNAYEHDA